MENTYKKLWIGGIDYKVTREKLLAFFARQNLPIHLNQFHVREDECGHMTNSGTAVVTIEDAFLEDIMKLDNTKDETITGDRIFRVRIYRRRKELTDDSHGKE